jgi:hypothetical protein
MKTSNSPLGENDFHIHFPYENGFRKNFFRSSILREKAISPMETLYILLF